MAKVKASKLSRKHVVVIERCAQVIREQAYKMRSIVEPGLDSETVEQAIVEQMADLNKAVDAILHAVGTVIHQVHEVPVVEDMSE